MARIMGIDYGTKRVGLAVTDPLQIVANGLTTVSSNEVIGFLKDYFSKEEVEIIVVGEPLSLDGTETNATQHVRGFVKRLKKHFPQIKVETIDEAFTSKMAMQAMVAGGMKKKKRREKGMIDKVSATIILQSYLESQ